MSTLSKIEKVFHDRGRLDCTLGRPMICEILEPAKNAYEAGYAARYEEEQQLTNQCEEQENGN